MNRLTRIFLLGFTFLLILHTNVSETIVSTPEGRSNETSSQTIVSTDHPSARNNETSSRTVASTDHPSAGNNETSSSQTNDTAPHEFPKNPSAYKFLSNSTILDNLKHHAETDNKTTPIQEPNKTNTEPTLEVNTPETANSSRGIDTEVEDLLHGGLFKNAAVNLNSIVDGSKNNKKAEEKSLENVDAKAQTELIQNGNNEDTRVINKFDRASVRDSHGRGVPLVQGQLAAILAAVFVIIAVIGYVGLLSWRRFLENRYGNREMLVNEEEFYDPTDMRHFSL